MAQSSSSQEGLTINNPNATRMNKDLMQAFQKALEKDPAADILSVVDRSYLIEHRKAQYRSLPEVGRYNLSITNKLHDTVIRRPNTDLRDIFPSDYARRYEWVKPKVGSQKPEQPKQAIPRDWVCEKFDPIKTASILYPLSDQASALLQKYSEPGGVQENSLAKSLKRLILASERLFELSIRGVVVKCSDEVAMKIFPQNRDLTEYHNLQYLADHACDLPIPKPHGLVSLGDFYAMFLSYIPGVTLDKVWSFLPHETKSSLQAQLHKIFAKLRRIKQDDGVRLGGVNGEGVKDYRIMEIFAYKDITTAKGFDELQFSAKHRASPCYVKLLRSFLKKENETLRGSVFTHGDFKKSNIMVRQDPTNHNTFTVTGIIDWEDGGFYPEYYECTTLSNGQSILTDDDWYLYVPDCISPLKYPVRWLVDRLWGNLLWSWRTDIVR